MTDKPNVDTYTCDKCKGMFAFGWSDEEAKKEALANGFDPSSCAIVCDDCYTKIMTEIRG